MTRCFYPHGERGCQWTSRSRMQKRRRSFSPNAVYAPRTAGFLPPPPLDNSLRAVRATDRCSRCRACVRACLWPNPSRTGADRQQSRYKPPSHHLSTSYISPPRDGCYDDPIHLSAFCKPPCEETGPPPTSRSGDSGNSSCEFSFFPRLWPISQRCSSSCLAGPRFANVKFAGGDGSPQKRGGTDGKGKTDNRSHSQRRACAFLALGEAMERGVIGD